MQIHTCSLAMLSVPFGKTPRNTLFFLPPVLCVPVGLQPCLTAVTPPKLCNWDDGANEQVKSIPLLSVIGVPLLLLH